jgi:type 1 glutamine amidotransferase
MAQPQKKWVLPADGDGGWRAFPDLLGATWQPQNIGHAPRGVFEVKWVDRNHPISRGLEPAFLANDELYHRLDLRPQATVLATAYDDPRNGGTGKDEPMIWTLPFGKGRAVHLTLGHDISAMYQPGFRTAFVRSVEWAASGEVTLPASAGQALPNPNALRVLVVTGGHSYPPSFYTLFEGWPEIAWSHATTQKEAFNARLNERYDVLVLHDMYEQIGGPEQEHLRTFIENGKGIVSIHHAIVNYTSWPWFYQQVTGGKFFTRATKENKQSQYKEGVDFVALPAKQAARHPVLRGVGPLPVHDEVYRDMWHSPAITVLMETDHPLNDRPVVYAGPHPKARSVYIQLGHGDETMRHPGFRRLVQNAILWTGRRVD